MADENIPCSLVDALRGAGHDVIRVAEVAPAAPDEQVLAQAVSDDRVLLTFDADFGVMIFARGFVAPRGVIYLRSPPPSPEETVRRVLRVVAGDAPSIDGYFVSIDRSARYHPLPQGRTHG